MMIRCVWCGGLGALASGTCHRCDGHGVDPCTEGPDGAAVVIDSKPLASETVRTGIETLRNVEQLTRQLADEVARREGENAALRLHAQTTRLHCEQLVRSLTRYWEMVAGADGRALPRDLDLEREWNNKISAMQAELKQTAAALRSAGFDVQEEPWKN